MNAAVFRIRRFSLDDGPGIRTTVFFKGCPLACSWCHNPEGIPPEPQILIQELRCIRCGECAGACLQNACTQCGRCAEVCPSGARRVCGIRYPIAGLLERLLKDRPFYESSGGGVTLSGGEPTLHMEYAGELARALKESGIHVALETCGQFDWNRFRESLLPYLDLVFWDLKLIDPLEHKRHTGVGNRVILANLARLREEGGPRIVVRTPVVPGITSLPANLQGIRDYVRRAGIQEHRLLPFNPCIPIHRFQGAESCRSTSIMR